MDNKEANIDLLFRNGLKNLEVLPPSGTWNNILPVIRRKQRPVILLRSAAVAAVLMSIAFLAYKWSQEISISFENPFAAFEQSVQPVDNPLIRRAVRRNPMVVNKITEPGMLLADAGNGSEKNTSVTAKNSDVENQVLQSNDEIRISDEIAIPELYGRESAISQRRSDITAGIINAVEPSYEFPREKINRWSLIAGGSPNYYIRQSLTNTESTDQIYPGEQSRISYSGGVGFSYKINRKLSIQSGIYYASVGNEVDGISSFAGFREFDRTKGDRNFEVLTSGGKIYTENSDVFLRDISGDRVLTRYTNDVFDPVKSNLSYLSNTLYQNFSYLEMPFILRYKVIDKSLDFNLIGGISYNFLLNNNVHTYIDGSRYNIGKTDGLNTVMVSSSMGLGIEYTITDKFSLNLEPTFRYYLNPFSDVAGIKVHPYSFGIFSGLAFKF